MRFWCVYILEFALISYNHHLTHPCWLLFLAGIYCVIDATILIFDRFHCYVHFNIIGNIYGRRDLKISILFQGQSFGVIIQIKRSVSNYKKCANLEAQGNI